MSLSRTTGFDSNSGFSHGATLDEPPEVQKPLPEIQEEPEPAPPPPAPVEQPEHIFDVNKLSQTNMLMIAGGIVVILYALTKK